MAFDITKPLIIRHRNLPRTKNSSASFMTNYVRNYRLHLDYNGFIVTIYGIYDAVNYWHNYDQADST